MHICNHVEHYIVIPLTHTHKHNCTSTVFIIGAHWLQFKGIQQCDFHCETLAVIQDVHSGTIEVCLHVQLYNTTVCYWWRWLVEQGAVCTGEHGYWTGTRSGSGTGQSSTAGCLSTHVQETLMILLCWQNWEVFKLESDCVRGQNIPSLALLCFKGVIWHC